MLLAVDIGNTNIVIALFEKNKIIHEWRIHSDDKRTADEYGSTLNFFLMDAKIQKNEITGGILSSVVPLLIGPFINLMQKIIGKKPVLVSPAIYKKLPISVPVSAVNEIGTDLISNAVQSFTQYKKPCIVADFGTALTFMSCSAKGEIYGVSIAPGIKTALNSLFTNTAQLPSVPLEIPENSLGTNTIQAIQAGIIFGYKGLVENMIHTMKNDMSKKGEVLNEIIVIATGGLNSVLKPLTNVFDKIDKDLTLKGLNAIYNFVEQK